MPYTATSKNLPANVKKLPEKERTRWAAIWNASYERCKKKGGKHDTCETRAFQLANGVLKESRDMTKLDLLIQESAQRELTDDQKEKLKDVIDGDLTVSADDIDEFLLELREARPMKTEDGKQFPAAAYAYVPDPQDPSTWKIRLWDMTGEMTRKQLGAATAGLSPGGFRGKKAQIPKADLAKVKAKIRAGLRKFGVKNEEMKAWIRESGNCERILSADLIVLEEKALDRTKDELTVTIMQPGFNWNKSVYYPSEVLSRDYKVFEGKKMFVDHQTRQEERDRPEGSLRDWAATLTDVWAEPDGRVRGRAKLVDPEFKEKVRSADEAGLLSEIGVSMQAIGTGIRETIDNVKTNLVESILKSRSVDFVTDAGAGGLVEMYESERSSTDIDLVDVATFKTQRPDIVDVIVQEARSNTNEEKIMAELAELEEKVATLEKERDEAVTKCDEATAKFEEAARDKAKAEAQSEIEKLIAEADLPKVSKERLTLRFQEAESTDGLEDAVGAEKKYLVDLNESGAIKGLGESAASGDDQENEKARIELKESRKQHYLAEGLSEKDAEQAAEIWVKG